MNNFKIPLYFTYINKYIFVLAASAHNLGFAILYTLYKHKCFVGSICCNKTCAHFVLNAVKFLPDSHRHLFAQYVQFKST